MSTENTKEIVTSFHTWLEEQGKHSNTIRSYSNDLRQFISWCRNSFGDDFTPAAISRGDIQDFRAFLLTRNSSPASVNRKVTALRQFFEFCIAKHFIEKNPAAEISGINTKPKVPPVLSRKDALLLVRTAERHPGPLDAAIILLLLHAGLRGGEICALTIGDVHVTPREGRLFIKGQRGKTTRFVYPSTRAQNALRRYMRWRGVSILAKRQRKEPLFGTYEGTMLTQQAIDQIVKRIGKIAGLSDITPTMLRNTYAASRLQAGMSAESVARSMGIASLKSLRRLKEDLDEDEDAG